MFYGILHFRPTVPKIFLKAPLATIYVNFKRDAQANWAGADLGFSRGGIFKILQIRPKKGVFRQFLTKKCVFSALAPLKISIYWVRHQKWISQNSAKGGPFESAGGRIPEIRKGRPSSPPLPSPNPLVQAGT